MVDKNVIISECDFMYCVAGQLYSQAPNREPRKADIILKKVKKSFRKHSKNYNEFYFIEIEKNVILDFIKNILMSIQEFKELNLSKTEVENNILVDDPNRSRFLFISRFSKYDSEDDFVCLDAFIRNVCLELNKRSENHD
jgi:hypothetical protein